MASKTVSETSSGESIERIPRATPYSSFLGDDSQDSKGDAGGGEDVCGARIHWIRRTFERDSSQPRNGKRRRVMTEEKRGFRGMDPEKQRAIASKGGKSAHAQGKAHEFSSEEAKIAGRKGGLSISKDKSHMSKIGKRGGQKDKGT
jgi:uncharacterized protein